ncbi:hypothetical protein JGS22_009330 [Streptomyces sp. P38-E01]|uniref:Secreted protein n=1 Tax=Streptomyces tardus TaxID=2780544 RepID=A0A949N1H2_9ACTN|nr:hypothetical protein [Streptomyces tardus]MBU7597815.1 hypothetical protein [Streptomyces tardus]
MKTRSGARTGRPRANLSVAALAALCTAAVALPATTARAADEQGGSAAEPAAYTVAEDAREVEGTEGSTDAPELTDTGYYKDSLGPGETKHYRVDLDSEQTAHLSALAHPAAGIKLGDHDSLEVELAGTDGTSCSSDDASFRGDTTPYPVVAYASRRVGGDSDECQKADQYLFAVTRSDESGSDPGDWPIEIRYALEPGLKGSRPAVPPKGSWSSEPPAPPSGQAKEVRGGTGMSTARPVGAGVWRDRVLPGETRYYRVPVDFGQQLFARVELPNAPKAGEESSRETAYKGFALHAYTSAGCAVVHDNFESYDGGQSAASLGLRPIDYGNRYDREGRALSTAGFYTLAVTMSADLQQYFPEDGAAVTLRVNLRGAPEEAPDYDGDARAAGFAVTDEDRDAARDGLSADEAAGSGAMLVVGIVGIGSGVALVLGLGAWAALARRRTPAAGAGAGAGVGGGGPVGPPQ